MKVIKVIPYKTFKERIRIVKENSKSNKVEIFKEFIYVESK